jgi:hypothetical protein
VVEGRGGEEGHLQVFSRYVVLPDGKRINLGADKPGSDSLGSDSLGSDKPGSDKFGGNIAVPTVPRSRARSQSQARPGGKRRSRTAKKIIAAGGTRGRRRR